MKNARPFFRVRSFRHACSVLGLLLIAALPDVTAAQTNPAVVGQWGPLETLDDVPVHITLLPDGRLLYWGRDKHPVDQWDIAGQSKTYTWHPTTKAKSTIQNSTTNLFCSGHSFLPDGRLLVSGGHDRYDPYPDTEGIGEDDLNVFNPQTNTWTRYSTRMPKGRWYPTNLTLGSGESVFISGAYWNGTTFWTPPGDVRSVPQAVLNPVPDMVTLAGHIWPFTASFNIPLYPYLHLTPAGKVFIAGPGPGVSRFFDPVANGGTFSNGTAPAWDHLEGTSVTFDAVNGKVLLVGGRQNTGGSILNKAEIITPSSTSATWQAAAPLNYGRKYHSATILPDGKVLVTGGTRCTGSNTVDCPDGAARYPELWNPNVFDPVTGAQIGSWTVMAPSPARTGYPSGIPRVYHSVGLLLPDGRVFVGGGGLPATGGVVVNGQTCPDVLYPRTLNRMECLTFGHKDAEIFSPPYLFNADGTPATRPVISSPPPASVSYGQTFSVGVANPGSITKASLVRLSSVTHGINQDQRVVFMTPSVNGTSAVSLTAPSQANTAPPGHYMLFLFNSNGVPSEAKIVQLTQDDGYLDGADCNQIWGWAWNRNSPNSSINVDLYDGSSYLTTVLASSFRQDLFNAGKGNGNHAFSYAVPQSMRDGKAHHISARFSGSSNNLGSSPRTRICDVSLFPTFTGSVSEVSGGGSTWEQATQFSSYVSGRITHLRYYRVPSETGSHVGRIWSENGTKLVEVAFSNETASGWQEVALPTPLQISAGVKYRVSYNVNTYGGKIVSGLSAPVMNWPLTAWTGVYSTPSGSFPNTGSVSNFLADFRFTVP